MPTLLPTQVAQSSSPKDDIFPEALSGLSDVEKADIRLTFLRYGVSEDDMPRYIADLFGVIETIIDVYISEKQSGNVEEK